MGLTIAAGIFLIRKDNKVLACHPTKHKPTFWSITKGRTEPGEDVLQTAVRETYEECNVDLNGFKVLHKIGEVKYLNGKKILHAYVLFEVENDFDFNTFDLKCNSNVPEKMGGFPEMDDYKWITLDEAEKCFHSAQVECLPQIRKIINNQTPNEQSN